MAEFSLDEFTNQAAPKQKNELSFEEFAHADAAPTGEYEPLFKGDPTAAVFNSLRTGMHQVGDQLVESGYRGDSVGKTGRDFAAGLGYGVTVGMGTAAVGAGEGVVNAAKYGMDRMDGAPELSNEDLAKRLDHHPIADSMDKSVKSFLGYEDSPAFEAGVGLPAVPFGAARAGVTEMGGPVAGVAFDAALIGYGAKHAYSSFKEGRAAAKVKSDLQDAKDRLNQSIASDHVVKAEDILNDLAPKRQRYQGSDPFADPDATMVDKLDWISQAKDGTRELNEPQRVMAGRLADLAELLGLDLTKDVSSDPAAQARLDSVKANGGYMPDFDTVAFRDKGNLPARVVIHEALHAVTANLLDKAEETRADPSKRPAHLKDVLEAADSLHDVYEETYKRVADKYGMTPEELTNKIDGIRQSGIKDQIDRDFMTTHYGLKDAHEFVTETMTRPEFQKLLASIKLNSTEVLALRAGSPRLIKNMWQAFKSALSRIVGGDGTASLLDVAVDHVTNLIDKTDERSRTQMGDNEAQGASRLALRESLRDRANKTLEKDTVLQDKLRDIAFLAKEAATPEEFVRRLKARWGSTPGWEEFVNRNAERMWTNRDAIARGIAKNTDRLSEADRDLGGDRRSVDEFAEQEIDMANIPKEKDDLQGGTGKMFGPQQQVHLQVKNFASRVKRMFATQADRYNAEESQHYTKVMSHFQEYTDLPRKNQLAVMDAAAKIDSTETRTKLRTLKLQWPTDEILQKQFKLTPEEISAYKGMTRGMDELHSMLNEALVKQGKPKIEQIPGYMPHVWDGAYKVLVKRIAADGTEKTVLVRGFGFEYGIKTAKFRAKDWAKKVDSGAFDRNGDKYRVEVDPQTGEGFRVQKINEMDSSLMANIQDKLRAYQSQLSLDPAVLSTIQAIEADAMRGFSKHTLERTESVGGYVGQHGTRNSLTERLGLGDRQNNKILTLHQNYAKNVTEFYKNTMFVDEVVSRLLDHEPLSLNGKTYYGRAFENTKVLQQTLREHGFNITGENINHFKVIDEMLQNQMIKLGVDPTLYRKVLRVARNYLTMSKLRLKIGNYVANLVQPAHTLGILEHAGALLGAKPGAAMVSMVKVMSERFHPDKDMKDFLAWAKDNHVLDAQLENQLHSTSLSPLLNQANIWTGGKVNNLIEGVSRETSAMIAYDYFRKLYPKDPSQARNAALQSMKMTMVNYDRQSRPLMYQNFGALGEAASPFAVFRNAYIGNTMIMWRMAKEHKLSPRYTMPLVTSQLVYLSTAGALGMIGAAEYNQLVDMANGFWPEMKLPRLEEMLMNAKVPDAITFGALSSATKAIPGFKEGVYVGSSMNSVSAEDPFSLAMAPMAKAFVQMLGIGVKAVTSVATDQTVPPLAADMKGVARQLLPAIAQGQIDRMSRPDWSHAKSKGTSLDGYVEDNPTRRRTIDFTGSMSVDEAHDRAAERVIDSETMATKAVIKALVSDQVDAQLTSKPGTMSRDVARKRALEVSHGAVTSEAFDQMVVDGYFNGRLKTNKERDAGLSTAEGAIRRYARQQLERTR